MIYLWSFLFIALVVSVFGCAGAIGWYGFGDGNLKIAIPCGVYVITVLTIGFAKSWSYLFGDKA